MSELPQAPSRRELREREQADKAKTIAGALRSSTSSARSARTVRSARSARSARPAKTGPRRTNRHHIVSKLLSLAAMVFSGALVIGMSVPASAFSAMAGTATSSTQAQAGAAAGGTADGTASTASSSAQSAAADIQSAAVDDDQPMADAPRDAFQVLSWAQVLAQKYAHISSYKYSGGQGSIRWPFPYDAPISSPFGPRIAPCSGCTSFHEGVDFTPGDKAPIYAVASGVVTDRDDGTGGYGNYVIITSQINGHTVRFTYAHMTRASSPIVLGQQVAVGDFIGLVGQTGEATGPHLHFEVNVDGTTIDPIPWLEANVN